MGGVEVREAWNWRCLRVLGINLCRRPYLQQPPPAPASPLQQPHAVAITVATITAATITTATSSKVRCCHHLSPFRALGVLTTFEIGEQGEGGQGMTTQRTAWPVFRPPVKGSAPSTWKHLLRMQGSPARSWRGCTVRTVGQLMTEVKSWMGT